MWIMIAGPYRTGARTDGERARNLAALNQTAYEVFKRGHIPIVGVNLALPIIDAAGEDAYEEIMVPISVAAARRCDGILRVGGESPGADEEVEIVRARGGRVFESLDEIPVVTPDGRIPKD